MLFVTSSRYVNFHAHASKLQSHWSLTFIMRSVALFNDPSISTFLQRKNIKLWKVTEELRAEELGTMLLMALLALCAFLPVVSTVTVSTRYGKIEGFTSRYSIISARFNSVNKFLGVPFASPPVGKLRLKPPQPPKEWKPRVRLAKEHGALCMQGKGLEFLTKLFAKNFLLQWRLLVSWHLHSERNLEFTGDGLDSRRRLW